jgi:hypothetical protein
VTLSVAQRWLPGRFTILLFVLPATILIPPLIGDSVAGRVVFNVFISLLLLGSLQATGLKKTEQVVAWALVVCMLVARWANVRIDDLRLHVATDILTALFLGFVAVELFLYVIRARAVDTNVLSAALCVCLLIGTVFAFLYPVIDLVVPGSFGFPSDVMNAGSVEFAAQRGDYIYFSLVTMTTTGFGDIRPVSQLARGLTVVEILIAQIYFVVMIARLVSLWGSGSAHK